MTGGPLRLVDQVQQYPAEIAIMTPKTGLRKRRCGPRDGVGGSCWCTVGGDWPRDTELGASPKLPVVGPSAARLEWSTEQELTHHLDIGW